MRALQVCLQETDVAGLAGRVSYKEARKWGRGKGVQRVSPRWLRFRDLLRSVGVPVNIIPSSEVRVTMRGDTTEFVAELR